MSDVSETGPPVDRAPDEPGSRRASAKPKIGDTRPAPVAPSETGAQATGTKASAKAQSGQSGRSGTDAQKSTRRRRRRRGKGSGGAQNQPTVLTHSI